MIDPGRVATLQRLVARERPVFVFLVPPAPDGERRDRRVGEVMRQRARLPCGVVRGMGDEAAPRRPGVGADRAGQRAQRRKREVPLERVVARRGRRHTQVGRGLHHPGVFEPVGEPEGSLMKEVVAHPRIAHRGLGTDGLERGVRPDSRDGREPTGIRHAIDADAAVVVRHMLDEPVDRVVGVGAFVGARMAGAGRTVHVERALGAKAATDVLEDEDVAAQAQIMGAPRHAGVAAGLVRRARHQDRQRPTEPGPMWDFDHSEQVYSVTRGDQRVGADPCRVRRALAGGGCRESESRETGESQDRGERLVAHESNAAV